MKNKITTTEKKDEEAIMRVFGYKNAKGEVTQRMITIPQRCNIDIGDYVRIIKIRNVRSESSE